ncbi:hypothetical protein [uncultured Tateyamaria sp.]|uniref:hypothetical protein n=1 Tax=uncultured Tateyamaria sp. TaxID=455651 RepID=UPI002620459D|nr:hypothetical protein [uncultured Tateyamaria sp.]
MLTLTCFIIVVVIALFFLVGIVRRIPTGLNSQKGEHLAYCKWSDNNGHCDVYVSGDLKRGWTTYVATKRHPEGRPLDWLSAIKKSLSDRGFGDDIRKAAAEARARCKVWEKENPQIPLDHRDAGATFKHANPRDCAINLERLKSEGLAIPQSVINELQDEADFFEQHGNDIPNGSQ